MSLQSGDRIGGYEVRSQLGVGGMGEVYRATDSKLKRDVALKVLPPVFASDPERMARFQHEAETLASLNHPNIAAIHGVEDNALVMELVEGESLKGPLPFDEAWKITLQIASALEYAHGKGIVHRDLKPANVMVTPEGTVKLLDFGLAKAFRESPDSSAGDPTNSPTMTLGQTVAGTILGTAAYMAPEQARGKRVDKRADIWAWGVLFYELLTGERLFKGDDIADTLAQVLTKDPDLASVPANVRPLLQRCLQKDPSQRLRDIGDAQALMAEPVTLAPPPMTSRLPLAGWIAAGLLAVALGVTAWALWPAPAELKPLVRLDLELDPPVSNAEGAGPILSPDGSRMVYVSQGRLYTRRLDEAQAVEIRGTDGAASPFFSPDGAWVGFYAQGGLKKASMEGGGVVAIPSEGTSFTRGGTWGEDGNITSMSGIGATPLVRIPAAGGQAEPVTELDRAQGETTQGWPELAPGGDVLLFTSRALGGGDPYIAAISSSTGDRKVVQPNAQMGRHAALSDGSGYLLYVTGGTLFAVPFDSERMETRGTPLSVVDSVATFNTSSAGAQFSVSRNGTLVYQRGGAAGATTLQWLDSTGKLQPLLAKPGDYLRPRLSPDGSRVALDSAGDVWTYDLQREIMTRLTLDGGSGPLWSPDGRFVLFSTNSGLAWTRSDGGAASQVLIPSQNLLYPWSFSPDGKRLAYLDIGSAGYDLFTVPIENDGLALKAGEPEAFLATPADERYPSFSPDGRWMVYTSDESGIFQIYVRAFPDGGGKVQVSSTGGAYPVWSRDGRTLFFRNLDNQIMTANYTVSGNVFIAERPRLWSEIRIAEVGNALNYDVHPDGQRIVALLPAGDDGDADSATHVSIVFNLFDELQRRAAAGN